MYSSKSGAAKHKSIRLALCLAIGVTLLAPLGAARASSPAYQPKEGCKPYIFVGMRGSGENPIKNYTPAPTPSEAALGQNLNKLYLQLKNDPIFAGRITFDTPATYQAAEVVLSKTYLDAVVKDSGRLLNERLDQLASPQGCPQSSYILAGYSQGAYAVHKVLTDLQNSAFPLGPQGVYPKIIGSVLLADPGKAGTGVLPFIQSYGPSEDGAYLIKYLSQYMTAGAVLKQSSWVPTPLIPQVQQLYTILSAANNTWQTAGTPIDNTFFSYDGTGDVVARTTDWVVPALSTLPSDLKHVGTYCPLYSSLYTLPIPTTPCGMATSLLVTHLYTLWRLYNASTAVHTNYLTSPFANLAQAYLDNRVALFALLSATNTPNPIATKLAPPIPAPHPTPKPTPNKTSPAPSLTPTVKHVPAPSPTPSSATQPASYALGSTGPGGGNIYYYSASGFNCGTNDTSTGSPTGGLCHYLEAAPSNWSSSVDPTSTWTASTYQNKPVPGLFTDPTPNSAPAAIGLGLLNSNVIAADNHNSAAELARTYRGASKSDWYLPDTAELNQLCKYAASQPWLSDQTPCTGAGGATPLLGLLRDKFYWSSSESQGDGAWGVLFVDGFKVNAGRTSLFYLRPIRAF